MKEILILIQVILVILNIFGLPGNVLSAIPPFLLIFIGKLTWSYFFIILVLIIIGEICEFLSSYLSGKYFGMSKKSIYFSMIFAIILGILMAPLMFGLGALIGAFLGAFLGTFIFEVISTRNFWLSLKRGFISLFGKITGTIIKLSIGLYCVYLTFIHG